MPGTTTLTGRDRYVIIPNDDENNTYSVRDLVTHQYLTTADGQEDLTYRDAYDLCQEYIHS